MGPRGGELIALIALALVAGAGVYVEKAMWLIILGFTPSTLGQIQPYTPTPNEWGWRWGCSASGPSSSPSW